MNHDVCIDSMHTLFEARYSEEGVTVVPGDIGPSFSKTARLAIAPPLEQWTIADGHAYELGKRIFAHLNTLRADTK